MKRCIPVILVLFFAMLASDGMSQKWKLRRYEGLIGIGSTNYFGTIGGSADPENLFGLKDLDIRGTRPSFYAGARYKIRQNWSVKAGFIYGFIAGSDVNSLNEARNAAFSATLFEPSAHIEYSIISEEQRHRTEALFNKRGMVNNYSRINLYIFAGVGGVFTNVTPKEDLEAHVDYDPSKLKSSGLAIPVGGGIKYVLSSDFSVGFEFGGRYATSKYLDGLHTSSAKYPDMYYFGLFNLVYRVKTGRNGAPIIFRRAPSGMF